MISKEEEKEFKKPKLYRFWNFLIYGSFIAIGVFLVYLYSAYVFINKWWETRYPAYKIRIVSKKEFELVKMQKLRKRRNKIILW